MKKSSSSSVSSGTREKRKKFSQSEVQTLIEQEVRIAQSKNRIRLAGLAEAIQRLDHGVNFEESIRKLEARIKMVTKRAGAALASMKKLEGKSSLPCLINMEEISLDSVDEATENLPRIDENGVGTSRDFMKFVKSTRKALDRMRTDNEALKAAIADVSKDLSPPVPRSLESEKVSRLTNKHPDEYQGKEAKVKELEQLKELETELVEDDRLPPGKRHSPTHTHSQQDEPSYPPLPPNPFPSVLSIDAASYNIPSKVKVHLALIKHPRSLSVLWTTEEEDPSQAPMDSYSVFITLEKVKGCGVFQEWRSLGAVTAIPMPMCVVITKYKPGHKVCVAVVGKDIFGRYGPYSEVVMAIIPEETRT